MAKTIDFTNFHIDLMNTIDGNGTIIQEKVMYGAERLGSDFTPLLTRDRAPLVRMNVKDAWKPASDTFTGTQALEVLTRFASFKEADIDLEFKLSDIKEAYKSYIGWLKTPGRTLNEVNNDPFELFFLGYILERHFELLRLNTAFKGVYNAAGSGAASLADGFIAKFATGRGGGGDIAGSHVFTAAAITAANAYDQVNGVANLVGATNEKLLNENLNVYTSRGVYDKYRQNRRTLFPNHVGPADRPETLDDFSNMTFVNEVGLSGKDTIIITPKENLLFVCNEDINMFSINVVKQIKGWQLTVRVSLDFDYATSDWVYLNDKV